MEITVDQRTYARILRTEWHSEGWYKAMSEGTGLDVDTLKSEAITLHISQAQTPDLSKRETVERI